MREGIRAQAAMTSVIECGAVRPPMHARNVVQQTIECHTRSITHAMHAYSRKQGVFSEGHNEHSLARKKPGTLGEGRPR